MKLITHRIPCASMAVLAINVFQLHCPGVKCTTFPFLIPRSMRVNTIKIEGIKLDKGNASKAMDKSW